MDIDIGQGLYLKIGKFADGGLCSYARTFLVIETNCETNIIKLLNISTIKGKENKLLFDSNKNIINYNPPFDRPSFVKLDAVYEITYKSGLPKLHNGQSIDPNELKDIMTEFNDFKSKHQVSILKTEAEGFMPIILKNN